MNCPIVKKTNTHFPAINSLPKNLRKKDGNEINAIKIGKEDQKN